LELIGALTQSPRFNGDFTTSMFVMALHVKRSLNSSARVTTRNGL